MDPWGYLIGDCLGIIVFVAALEAISNISNRNSQFCIFYIGFIIMLIPFGLSYFSMNPILGGFINAIIGFVFIVGSILCILILIGIMINLISKLFICFGEWLSKK